MGDGHFAQHLAARLDPEPPRWPIDAAGLEAWTRLFAGWSDADPSIFRAREINVDHAIALVVFEQRHNYPAPPPFSSETPPEVFERWRIACCLDVLDKHLPRVFRVVCDLVDSVKLPVVCGSELGTSPQDSLLTRMLVFKYSRRSFLKILLQEGGYDADAAKEKPPVALVHGRPFSPDRLLSMIRRAPDGSVDLAPELLAG